MSYPWPADHVCSFYTRIPGGSWQKQPDPKYLDFCCMGCGWSRIGKVAGERATKLILCFKCAVKFGVEW